MGPSLSPRERVIGAMQKSGEGKKSLCLYAFVGIRAHDRKT